MGSNEPFKPTFQTWECYFDYGRLVLIIPAKKNEDEDKKVFISSPIVITARFIDPETKVEKIILSDFNNTELIEEADILSSQKLPSIIKFDSI